MANVNNKKKKNIKEIKIIIGVIVFCIVGFISYLGFFLLIPKEQGEIVHKVSFPSRVAEQKTVDLADELYNFHPSLEEALQETQEFEEVEVFGEIHRFSNEKADILVMFGKKNNKNILMQYIFLKKEGLYSFAITRDQIPLNTGCRSFSANSVYTESDIIASNIKDSFSNDYLLSYINEEKPIYYGVAKEKEIYDLRILDRQPSNIIPFDFEGKTYYYWYYEGISFLEELNGKMSLKHFTLNEMTELLDIKFIDN